MNIRSDISYVATSIHGANVASFETPEEALEFRDKRLEKGVNLRLYKVERIVTEMLEEVV